MKRFLTFLLTALGFGAMLSGCNIFREEYGSPHSEWEIKGIVTDPEGNPIKGIKVTPSNLSNYYNHDFFTDEAGFYDTGFIPTYDGRPTYIDFDDIDGPENGGEFESSEYPISFIETDFKGGDGHWYQGKAIKTVNITMTLKPESNEE